MWRVGKPKTKSGPPKRKRIRIRRKKKPSSGSENERGDERRLINFVPEKYLEKAELEEIRLKNRIRAKKPYRKVSTGHDSGSVSGHLGLQKQKKKQAKRPLRFKTKKNPKKTQD